MFDGGTQRFDVFEVARELLGTVVEHRDSGSAARYRTGPIQLAPGGHGHRWGEADARHQQGVAEERVELAKVLHTALSEIDVRLQRDPRRDGRMAHQIGV